MTHPWFWGNEVTTPAEATTMQRVEAELHVQFVASVEPNVARYMASCPKVQMQYGLMTFWLEGTSVSANG